MTTDARRLDALSRRAPLLSVDLRAVQANWRGLNALAPAGAVLKANAYGVGMIPVARALWRAGCRDFFVANRAESEVLHAALTVPGPAPFIHVLGGMGGTAALEAGMHNVLPVLNSMADVQAFVASAGPGQSRHLCDLHVDIGMSRLGLSEAEVAALLAAPELCARLDVNLIIGHLSCGDDPTNPANARELARFQALSTALKTAFPQARRSLAATGGAMLGPVYHFDLLRPGIGLYGGAPLRNPVPALRLSAPVLQIQTRQAGEPVGYGGTWVAERPTKLATVGIGYADGLPRSLSNAGLAHVGGAALPIVGRVSMDLTVLDITNAPTLELGDWVDFIGPEQSIDALAARAGMINYEVLTGLGARCLRQAMGGEA